MSLFETYDALKFNSSSLSISSNSSSLISNQSSTSRNSLPTDYASNSENYNSNPIVQVGIRLRPLNQYEAKNQIIKKIVELDLKNKLVIFKERKNDEIRYKFKFDNLFYSDDKKTNEESQDEIYLELGKPNLQSVFEGNDLCYFAYGQTGSGKSYTIMGDESCPGLIFRFAKQIFDIISLNKELDLNYLFRISNDNSKENNLFFKEINLFKDLNNNVDSDSHKIFKSCDVPDKFNFETENSFEQKIKDKVLRFNENIEIYKDDLIYHEKLVSEKDEVSSIDSLNEEILNKKIQNQINKEQNLVILKNIFQLNENLPKETLKIDFKVKISFYEIYNESVFDLLELSDQRVKSKPREHPITGPYIENLTIKEIFTIEELYTYFELGNNRRSKSATSFNERSSRSHAVFTIYIYQTYQYEIVLDEKFKNEFKNNSPNKFRTKKIFSKITFVDLAGSERASANYRLTMQKIKEGNSINKSLFTLGKVINKLAWINKCLKKTENEIDLSKIANNSIFYVPYRDSVLTWLLKDCFGGKCKTFMIATIASTSNHFYQTLSTLRYAYKASTIKVPIKLNNSFMNNSFSIDKLSDISIKKYYADQIEILKNKSYKLNDNDKNQINSNSCLIDEISKLFKNYLI